MDYVPPLEVVSNMVGAGSTKSALPAKDLLIRGFLSGALLGFATWIRNQIPVTIGNFIGGAVFTGFALYLTYGQKKEASPATIAPSAIAEPGPVS